MIVPDKYRLTCRILRVFVILLLVLLAAGFLAGAYHAFFVMSEPQYSRSALERLASLSKYSSEGVVLRSRLSVFGIVGYMLALWSVQKTLGDLAAGRLFHPTVARGLRIAGSAILAAAMYIMVVVGSVSIFNNSGFWFQYINLQNIIIAVIGIIFIILARVVDQAREVKTELDEIF